MLSLISRTIMTSKIEVAKCILGILFESVRKYTNYACANRRLSMEYVLIITVIFKVRQSIVIFANNNVMNTAYTLSHPGNDRDVRAYSGGRRAQLVCFLTRSYAFYRITWNCSNWAWACCSSLWGALRHSLLTFKLPSLCMNIIVFISVFFHITPCV